MKRIAGAVLTIALSACAGTQDYIPSIREYGVDNAITIERPREAVWKAAIPRLGREFFVINNLDQSSGFVNLSYSGDPEAYVDCGQIRSMVSNAQGERVYLFPAARAAQTYEVMIPQGLFIVDRRMKLEGRINLIFEEVSPTSSRVTANTRYVLERETQARHINGAMSPPRRDSISFNTGQRGTFPQIGAGPGVECRPTGKLEADLIRLVQ